MKKTIKWMGIAVLTPILLFIILTILIYLPPVQNWAVRKVASVVSEKTGMDITVEHVTLEFPLNLGMEGFRALHQNDSIPQMKDTIADVKKMVADVRLWPLLKKQVIINELSLQQAKLNTNGFISDLRIKGELNELWLSSKGIDLDQETAEVNGARLEDARLDIALSDTAAVDTTESDFKWRINADSLSIRQTELTVHLPGDTLLVNATMSHAVAKDAHVDLETKTYKVGSLDWEGGTLRYDACLEPASSGLDYNHLDMRHVTVGIDSISYTPSGTSLYIRRTSFKEKSGLEITSLQGGVRLDSAFNQVTLPQMQVSTPYSTIYTEADINLTAFDNQTTGKIKLKLDSKIGKQDLLLLASDLPPRFKERFPYHPLSIKGSVNGNMQHLEFTDLDISLPTAFHATASGYADQLTDLRQLTADITLDAQTQNLDFVKELAGSKELNDYRIPNDIRLSGSLRAQGPHYSADMTAHEGNGKVHLNGTVNLPLNDRDEPDISNMSYEAQIGIGNLNLHHFMPKDSLYSIDATINAKGHGTDFLAKSSRLEADADIRTLQYGSLTLKDINATAFLQNGRGQAHINSRSELFNGDIGVDALLNPKRLDGTFSADINKADLYQLKVVDKPLTVSMCGHIDVNSNLQDSHHVTGLVSDLLIKTDKQSFRPADIALTLHTTPDTTYTQAESGDLRIRLHASGGYERLLKQGTTLADSLKAQFDQKVIDQQSIKQLLPTLNLQVESKRDNPLANVMRTRNIDFKELKLNLSTSPQTGINGESYLYSLNYDSTRIDTIRLNLKQKGERLTYNAQICNNKRNPQFVFNTLIDGHIHEHGALAGLRYFDERGKMGLRIGATVDMEAEGLRFKLLPDRPTLGYKEFLLNKDNYIFLDSRNKIQAKVDLIADDKTGLKIYTENQDSTMLQDLTVSVNRFDLGELTSVMPYMPRITGYLNGDYHIVQDQDEHISVASDMGIQRMTYEGSPIGNINTEFVYLMKEDDTHAIEARLMLDDEEFGILGGSYKGNGEIDATFDMNRLPLSIANGFVPDQLVGLDGYGEGQLTIKGTAANPLVNGEVYLDSAYLVSIPYGIRMRFDNDPVRIVDSRLLLENFGLYAYNDQPLVMMGNIDFTNTDRITMDMRMRAQDLQLIKAKREAKSVAFGKAFVNFYAQMQGPLEQLNIRGKLDVLGNTDMTYLLLDSPLSTDNRLDELVKFTDFSDTTQTVITRPTPSGLTADLTIGISQGAHIICDLNADETNYVDLMGGGDLRMKYDTDGIHLTGRYTLSNGQMKYSLPVIPLKTFTIKDGSYVEFNGEAMNPKLNITATERTKATVSDEGGSGRSVAFDCGVIITKTLNDMGLQFIIEAPEDNTISNELAMMSAEERGKLAVTMLTTGMYLANGDTNGFSMNSALSSFLQSEINSIAGSALKTLDLSLGIDNTTDNSGAMRTDYSFKFAKRFLDNRLKIELGGKVSSGNGNMAQGQKQSFFDNVTMEYRLNQNATQNVKLFYQQNVYDWLEGYTSMYGGGFVWRRKLDNFWDIFNIFRTDTLKTDEKK